MLAKLIQILDHCILQKPPTQNDWDSTICYSTKMTQSKHCSDSIYPRNCVVRQLLFGAVSILHFLWFASISARNLNIERSRLLVYVMPFNTYGNCLAPTSSEQVCKKQPWALSVSAQHRSLWPQRTTLCSILSLKGQWHFLRTMLWFR